MSKGYKGSQGLCRSIVALPFLKNRSAAFLPPDVKRCESCVADWHCVVMKLKAQEWLS